MGYSPIAAGSASLPVTALMLVGSARAGEVAQRIGPRIPLTLGPLIIAAGLLLMLRINPGDSYVSTVLPAVVVFGLGLTLVVAPVTATVMAAVNSANSGIASGVNNAVARVAGLLAVAVIPVIAGLTGDSFYDPDKMTHGFHVGMVACAILSLIGAVIAWTTISADVLHEEGAEEEECDYTCGVGAPAMRPPREAAPAPELTGGT
jgi:MFS family permease